MLNISCQYLTSFFAILYCTVSITTYIHYNRLSCTEEFVIGCPHSALVLACPLEFMSIIQRLLYPAVNLSQTMTKGAEPVQGSHDCMHSLNVQFRCMIAVIKQKPQRWYNWFPQKCQGKADPALREEEQVTGRDFFPACLLCCSLVSTNMSFQFSISSSAFLFTYKGLQ